MKKQTQIYNSKKGEKSNIWIGADLLKESWVVENIVSMAYSVVLLVDEQIDICQLERLKPYATLVLFVPGGEAVKNLIFFEKLLNNLIEAKIGSDSVIVACGGGATLDLAGFLAATYCRGVKLCLLPSTLLAMTDASIGGKNGINVGSVKNIVGTLYHPEAIFIDVTFLDTLPLEELNNGLVEMAKHAILDGKESCERFKSHLQSLKEKNRELLVSEIYESVSIKKRFVEDSFTRPERRHLLNFGHTIGHAIESLECFSCSHGQAVAMGIVAESLLALKLAFLPSSEYAYIESLIHSLEVPMTLSRQFSRQDWFEVMKKDKKAALQRPKFVLPRAVGAFVAEEGECVVDVPEELLGEVVSALRVDMS